MSKYLTEAKRIIADVRSKKDHKDLHDFARETYSNIAPDLYVEVPHGQGHFVAAHDHIADRMHDKFSETHPNANFSAITKSALKNYVNDDRKETRSNEAKRARREAAAARPARVPKEKKKKPTWWEELGYTKKPRKGIGSH